MMAAECYEKLTDRFPELLDYKIYHAQSLYNAFLFPEAVAVLAQVFRCFISIPGELLFVSRLTIKK